jgi:hypothetical protein
MHFKLSFVTRQWIPNNQRSCEKGGIKMNGKRKTLLVFVAGMLAMLAISISFTPAFAAALRDIKVTVGDVKIYVDGKIQVPKDANGNTVEPLIYNGTTYLPVRALTGMLTDKTVEWDQAAFSVYIGGHPTDDGSSIEADKDSSESTDGYPHSLAPGNVPKEDVLGTWEVVDFVKDASQFDPEKKFWADTLDFLTALDFTSDDVGWHQGNVVRRNYTASYIEGSIIEDSKAHYYIQEYPSGTYLLVEWMSGDVTRGNKPGIYVFKKQ